MKNKSNLITIGLSILFVGLVVTILDAAGQTTKQAVVQPTRDLIAISARLTPILNITSTPAPPPRAVLEAKVERPTRTAVKTEFVFSEAVPVADSPEFAADDMNACFSMYTRRKNEMENGCQGEWYPADYAPRSYDEYWCATNGGRVGWVPVRFFDGRAGEQVQPYGKPAGCH